MDRFLSMTGQPDWHIITKLSFDLDMLGFNFYGKLKLRQVATYLTMNSSIKDLYIIDLITLWHHRPVASDTSMVDGFVVVQCVL